MSLKVLCLDVEGGYGGSSRSLYESLRHIDRQAVTPEVWCARAGPIQYKYAALGLTSQITKGMPRFSALPHWTRNLWGIGKYCLDFWRGQKFLDRLEESVGRFDLVHLNHESLHGVALWLRQKFPHLPLTMHVRTMLQPSIFASWQSSRMTRGCDGLIFITENEQARFHMHLRECRRIPEVVILNIAEVEPAAQPHPAIPKDGRLIIACLSNFAWVRGVDRVVEVAIALRDMGRHDVLFVMAGNMQLPKSLPGDLGVIARRGGDLRAYAELMNVQDSFLFLGHVAEPEQVLAAADMLIKPTREDNPWGRDIIEALAMGRPVLSVGAYKKFVETGVTGILQSRFDARALAEEIALISDNRAQIRIMGEAAKSRVASLCNGSARASDLLQFWQYVVAEKIGTTFDNGTGGARV